MRFILGIVFVALIVLVLSGCKTGSWEKLSYNSPGNKINFNKNAKVRILTLNKTSQLLNVIIKELEKEFTANRYVSIDRKHPDYIIAMDLQRAFRSDTASEKQYNAHYSMKSEENDYSGRTFLDKTDKSSASNATFVSVVIYRVEGLIPENSFELLIYDSQLVDSGTKMRTQSHYVAACARQVIAKIKDAMLTKPRVIDTYLPKNADKTMLQTLTKNKFKGFLKRGKEILPVNWDKFVTDIQNGKYKDKEDDLEKTLSNCYLYAIFLERLNYSPKALKYLFSRQLKIMQITSNEALVIGCANSLGRLEAKWKILNNTDIGGEK
jgi:hypothetical protein